MDGIEEGGGTRGGLTREDKVLSAWHGFTEDVVVKVAMADAESPINDDLDIFIRVESYEVNLRVSSSLCVFPNFSTVSWL